MRVTITRLLPGPVTLKRGDVVDLADRHARRLIQAGYATPAAASAELPLEHAVQPGPPETRKQTRARSPRRRSRGDE